MNVRSVEVEVNGVRRALHVEPRTLLSDALRDQLGLVGLHAACEQGACGTCTVLWNGRTVRSCLTFAIQVEGQELTTVEGVGSADALHPVQEALARHHGLQCGYCTSGVVLSAIELLEQLDEPSADDVAAWMSGNLCRCTGYRGIVEAITALAAAENGKRDDHGEQV